jgi:hypothetical protein
MRSRSRGGTASARDEQETRLAWGYDEDTVLQVLGRDEPFHHTDRHTLRKVGDPTPNPLLQA